MPFSMKTLRFLLILALLAGICSCKGPSDLTFTLVQYNVGVFNKYEESGVDVIALVARELGADVMTLNEVDSCTTRTGQVDQLAAFAAEMDGWNHHYAAAMPYRGGAYGVGVASSPSFPVVRTDRIALPKVNGYEPRAVAIVEYDDFIVASTHLDLTLQAQLGQVEVLNHYIDSVYADCGKPFFIGGDFNCLPDSEPIEMMKKSWIMLTPDTFSFPSGTPEVCIDYVFVRPNGKEITVESASVPWNLLTVDLAVASDHLPAAVTVTIKCGSPSAE